VLRFGEMQPEQGRWPEAWPEGCSPHPQPFSRKGKGAESLSPGSGRHKLGGCARRLSGANISSILPASMNRFPFPVEAGGAIHEPVPSLEGEGQGEETSMKLWPFCTDRTADKVCR
jgi:hypothetical protein